MAINCQLNILGDKFRPAAKLGYANFDLVVQRTDFLCSLENDGMGVNDGHGVSFAHLLPPCRVEGGECGVHRSDKAGHRAIRLSRR